MSRDDDIVNNGYTTADPDDPRIGTSRGPGRRPGARKPGRKQRDPIRPYTPEERRAAIQRRIAKEVAKADFARRAVELRRLNHTYVEIAELMSVERGELISTARVRRHVLNELRDTEALADVRYAELDKLESQAANIRKKLDEMDAQPPAMLDMELYAKIAETYLKYRERIAKLVGLDAPTRQQVERTGALPPPGMALDGGSVHVGADGVTIRMPGSIAAFEDWAALEEKGLTGLAGEVLELEASEHEEVPVGLHRGDKAGVTLRPDVDVTPEAERRHTSALDALDVLGHPDD